MGLFFIIVFSNCSKITLTKKKSIDHLRKREIAYSCHPTQDDETRLERSGTFFFSALSSTDIPKNMKIKKYIVCKTIKMSRFTRNRIPQDSCGDWKLEWLVLLYRINLTIHFKTSPSQFFINNITYIGGLSNRIKGKYSYIIKYILQE